MMAESKLGQNQKVWKKFLRNHWKMLILFIVVAIVACIGAILVFLWFVGEAQISGLVPTTLNLWTMGYIITFLLHVIFWEILYIGIPVLVIVAIAWQFWWKKLPDEERQEYKRGHLFGKRSRKSDGGGAVSFLINIAFIIKVYYDGNWNIPFAEWTFDYLVYSYLWALIWILIIIGIPMLLGGSWWIIHEMKKNP